MKGGYGDREEIRVEAQIQNIADEGTVTEIVCNQDKGEDNRAAFRADQSCEQHAATGGVRLRAGQQFEHEHPEGQGEEDVAGKGQALTGGRQIVKLVSNRRHRRPAEETEVIAQAAAVVQEALHNQIGGRRAGMWSRWSSAMSSAIKSLSSNAFHFLAFIRQKDTSHNQNKNSALTGYQAARKNVLDIFEVLLKKRKEAF